MYTTSLYCTGTLCTFSDTVSTNRSRLHSVSNNRSRLHTVLTNRSRLHIVSTNQSRLRWSPTGWSRARRCRSGCAGSTIRWGSASLTPAFESTPVSKFDCEKDNSAFNLNPGFPSLRRYISEGRHDSAVRARRCLEVGMRNRLL